VRPVLESFSSDVVWVGELGTGSVTKIVHNALAMSVDLLVTECLTLGVKGGVELPRLIEAFKRGAVLEGNAISQANARDSIPGRLFAPIRPQSGVPGLRPRI
jgi:3-hydroxyisobutyrate dehydrogenase